MEVISEHGMDIVGIEVRIANRSLEPERWIRSMKIKEDGFRDTPLQLILSLQNDMIKGTNNMG